MKKYTPLIISGVIIGVIAIALVQLGNPANMGFCIACFMRDIVGALGFHSAPVVQYARPEVLGIIFGAFVIAIKQGEFSVKAGSSPVARFVIGNIVMIGALIFLGCPLRMVIRIGGGDLNAVVGLVGFIAGAYVGSLFLNRGFSLRRNYNVPKVEGFMFPLMALGIVLIALFAPSLLKASVKGPGAMHAPLIVALIAGIIVGIVGHKTRVCFVGGIRDSFLLGSFSMLIPNITIIIVVAIGNLIFGTFNLSFIDQPIAHSDGLWNFLGLSLVGFGSVLLGGCPFRQLVLAGSGNSDSAVSVLGMMCGAALAHNFGLASSGKGVTFNGQVAFSISLIALLIIAFYYTKQSQEA